MSCKMCGGSQSIGTGHWICCDSCNRWFHAFCMNLSKHDVEKIANESWECPIMNIEEAPLIYGLELPARCLCAQNAETNIARYLVATQSLRQENQIHLIVFDDETNQLEKTILPHPAGEVWQIASSYNDALKFSTIYNSYTAGQLTTGCKIWNLPKGVLHEDGTLLKSNEYAVSNIEEVMEIRSNELNAISHVFWKPLEDDSQVMVIGGGTMQVWDLPETSSVTTIQLPDKKGYQCSITAGKWNPHHGAKQFAVATGQSVLGWDLRCNKMTYTIDNVHGQLVRDLDYNPNKQYHMVTCGDDCYVKFWDTRYVTKPLATLADEHSHWVWSARFNPFHDQLVLSGGSDSRVVLYNKASISSEPYGHLLDNDSDESDSSNADNERKPVKDGLIAVFEEHEDSVYAVEWSSADPWSFASLSYDGRVVINKVPQKIKFDILL